MYMQERTQPNSRPPCILGPTSIKRLGDLATLTFLEAKENNLCKKRCPVFSWLPLC
jgi:hypothetical protein